MPSPFPGIDPYVEAQGRWGDFHHRLIALACDAIQDRLPADYVAQFDEQIELVTEEPPGKLVYPDIASLRGDHEWQRREQGGEAVAVLDTVAVEYALTESEERHVWIEILKLPEQRLLTVVEVLSPTNKRGGRKKYLAKRHELLGREVHLVEIDLLAGGQRLPMGRGMPPGDFYAIIGRYENRLRADVLAWSIRQPLPKVPIPLLAPDPDVVLDLAEVVATSYERGRYARLIDYARPLELPLDAGDREWAEGIARGALAR